jgi:hypothetical protein
LAVVLLACLAIILLQAKGHVPQGDLDTQHMLLAIKQRGNPWSWFSTDWPLQNGFYRPITALSFELDLLVFPSYGYGLSAAIYCALCVLTLFWLARELTESPSASAAAALLFALWHTPIEIHWDWISWAIAALVAVSGFARHGMKVGRYLPAVLAITFLATELAGVHVHEAPSGFYAGVLHWIPSRTATVMTMFALASLAAYCRFIRLGGAVAPKPGSPLDLPATRTSNEASAGKFAIGWLAVSGVCVLLALGSYEQAVMLPAVLFLVGGVFCVKGYRIAWPLHLIFWVELVVYFLVRRAALPVETSIYMQQQLRTGFNVIFSALNYVAPCTSYAGAWLSQLSLGASVLLVSFFYSFPVQVAGNVSAYVTAFRQNRVMMLMWLCSILAFLPMAFLKPFSHYHYWSMSLRSIFVVLLVGAIWKMAISAASPPTLRAPKRLSPAPGSLRHQ